jgi:hypothetical protein
MRWHTGPVSADPALPDGTYDAMVVDVHTDGGGGDAGDAGRTRVELTLLGGERKGEVVAMTTPAGTLAGDPLDLLGVPATITVTGGRPSVRFEP